MNDHGAYRIPSSQEDPLGDKLHRHAKGGPGDDREVGGSVGDDGAVWGEKGEKRPGEKKAEEQKDSPGEDIGETAV